MSILHGLEETDIEEAIADGDQRGLFILHVAFAMGVALFTGVTLMLRLTQAAPAEPTDAPNDDVFAILSGAHAVVMIGAWALGAVLFRAGLAQGLRGAPNPDRESNMIQAMSALRGAWILRAAFREGSALFGIVIVLIAGDALARQPLYWLNLLDPALFVLWALANLPTKPRIARVLHDQAAAIG